MLSKGRKAGSGGALFVGRVAIAERVETAFKRLFCALWVRIGKEGCEGVGMGRDRGRENKKGRPPGVGRRPYSALRLVVFGLA